MPLHLGFPDEEVLAGLVFPEELDMLQLVVDLLLPLVVLHRDEIGLLVKELGDPFVADSHILARVALVEHDKPVVIGVRHPVQVKKVLAHLGE